MIKKRVKKIDKQIEISPDKRHLFVNEEDYIFRNFFGDVGFQEGIHYWEIIADSRTEHELKVGVSSINEMQQAAEYKIQVE